MLPEEAVQLDTTDIWVKVVAFLQQNWAVAAPGEAGRCTVFFVSDASVVFDRLTFGSADDAIEALRRNGFRLHREDPSLAFTVPPKSPFRTGTHPNGAIYSSGRFWR